MYRHTVSQTKKSGIYDLWLLLTNAANAKKDIGDDPTSSPPWPQDGNKTATKRAKVLWPRGRRRCVSCYRDTFVWIYGKDEVKETIDCQDEKSNKPKLNLGILEFWNTIRYSANKKRRRKPELQMATNDTINQMDSAYCHFVMNSQQSFRNPANKFITLYCHTIHFENSIWIFWQY